MSKSRREWREGRHCKCLRLLIAVKLHHSLPLCMQAEQTAMEELTQGQAATLVRNEQNIDNSMEEMESTLKRG